jgi:hypothetical protein
MDIASVSSRDRLVCDQGVNQGFQLFQNVIQCSETKKVEVTQGSFGAGFTELETACSEPSALVKLSYSPSVSQHGYCGQLERIGDAAHLLLRIPERPFIL